MPNKRTLPRQTRRVPPKKTLTPVQIAADKIDIALKARENTKVHYPENELKPQLQALSAAKAYGGKPVALTTILYFNYYLGWQKSVRSKLKNARIACMQAGMTREASNLVAMIDDADKVIRLIENLLLRKKRSRKKFR